MVEEYENAWLEEVKGDQAKLERRQESSFLMYQDHDGRFADFHAARHTYISQIVAGGSSVKVAQELARHSTSRLTIDRYAHANLHDVTAALDALPETRVHKPSVEVLSATGTEAKFCISGIPYPLWKLRSYRWRWGVNNRDTRLTARFRKWCNPLASNLSR